MLLGYFWVCVVSYFQVIFIVNSSKYRRLYGENPLSSAPTTEAKPITNEPFTVTKPVERVRFYPLQQFKDAEKPAPTPKIEQPKDKRNDHPFGINQSERLRNDYIEMRRNYLNQNSFGHGQTGFNY